jgi:hypothetical protein
MCFNFLYKFDLKHFSFEEKLREIWSKIYIGLHVQYPLFLLDFNPLPSLTLQSARDLNVPCRPKHSKALLLSYTFKCQLKKKRSLSAHAVGL